MGAKQWYMWKFSTFQGDVAHSLELFFNLAASLFPIHPFNPTEIGHVDHSLTCDNISRHIAEVLVGPEHGVSRFLHGTVKRTVPVGQRHGVVKLPKIVLEPKCNMGLMDFGKVCGSSVKI